MSSKIYTPRLKILRPVLEYWTRLNESVARKWEYQDCPWWYIERTFVGILAAACIRANGCAIEEYSGRKSWKGRPYKGRCDLFLQYGNAEYACEAKHHWSAAGSRASKSLDKLKEAMKNAENDAKRGDQTVSARLALLFAVPFIPHSEIHDLSIRLANWQEYLWELEPDAMAWTFPKGGEKLLDRNGKAHPGVAVILREVNRD